jgi:hypothetical protein
MRTLYKPRTLLLAGALVALFASGLAFGATTAVTLGPSGPQPATVTVQWGDTVSFANAGGNAYGITIPRLTVASPAIPPGGSWAQVFNGRTGNYIFRQTGARNFSGSVVVQLTGSVTMAAKPTAVTYGKRVALSGKSLAGFPVKVEQQPAGQAGTWTERASVQAGADGAWSTSVLPVIGGRYRASAAADQLRSSVVSVGVRPRISLVAPRRMTAGRRVPVRARIAPATAASSADLERYDTARRRWTREDRRRVGPGGTVAFRWSAVKGRSLLRVQLFRVGMRTGFEPASTRPVAVTGF